MIQTKKDNSGSVRNLKKQLREALANYMASEGCSCCESSDHKEHKEILGNLLSVKKYKDDSGYDFNSYKTKEPK